MIPTVVGLLAVAVACAPIDSPATSAGMNTTARPPGSSGSTNPSPSVPSVLAGRPNQIVHEQRTFVDPSRKTPAGKTFNTTIGPAEQPSRTLVTEVYYPVTPGPRPLILFSHGLSGHPDKFTKLLTAWATAGYIVTAPAFPLTNAKVPGNQGNAFDLWDQPKDISFVLDQVLAAASKPGDTLDGRVDPTRLGAAGLSLGGATTYGLGFNDCCREPRFKAVEVLAGQLLPLPTDYTFDRTLPVLIMHGDKDPALAYSGAVRAFGLARPPKYLVTLIGGSHAPPFEDDVTPYDELVEKTTVDFWDVFLAGEAGQLTQLEGDAVVDGLSTLQSG